MKFLLIICIFLPFLDVSSCVNISCTFNHANHLYIGLIYMCNILNSLDITSPEMALIENSANTHQTVMDDDDVIGFNVVAKNIQYFPQGLSQIFPNLKSILIHQSGLKEIHRSDLEEYSQLIVLNLWNNQIEILEEDLFKHNSELAFLSLGTNKIFHIDPKAFDGAVKLIYIHMHHNTCIGSYADNNRNAVEQIFKDMKTKCIDRESTIIDGKISKLANESKTLDSERFMTKLLRFEKGFKTSRFYRFQPQKRNFESLKNLVNNENNEGDLSETENARKLSQPISNTENSCKINEVVVETLTNALQNQTAQTYNENFSDLDKKISILVEKISNIEEKLNDIDKRLTAQKSGEN